MKNTQLSVIIPTYNERENIEEIIKRLEKSLREITFEVIFVDDDSPDGTSDVVKEQRKKRPYVNLIQRVGRRGLAGAVIEGILSAKSDISAVMDCDLQHDEAKLIEMYSLFNKKTDSKVIQVPLGSLQINFLFKPCLILPKVIIS